MNKLEEIHTIKDPRVIEARELASAAGRKAAGKCLLEGEQALTWALHSGWMVERVFCAASHAGLPLLSDLQQKGCQVCHASEGILKKISDTNYLIPLIGVARIPAENLRHRPQGDFVLVLDDVRDHGNIGTILRTAQAFGVREVVSTTGELDLFYRKMVDASRGTVFRTLLTPYASVSESIAALKAAGYQIVATSPYAPSLQSAARLQPRPVALVVGNETRGIDPLWVENADVVVQIPMSRQVESLNVGVAAGISIYELKWKLVMAMLINLIRSTLGRELNVTGKHVQLALDARLREVTPLNSTQVILLMVMKCDNAMPMEQAARDTSTFGEELQALITPLLAEGLVQQSDETLRLTEKGETTLAQLWGVVERSQEEILEGFSEAERGMLMEYLQRIQTNCAHILAEAGGGSPRVQL